VQVAELKLEFLHHVQPLLLELLEKCIRFLISEWLNLQILNIVNQKHLIYALFPFIVGLVLKRTIFNDSDISYWFLVGVLCLASMFVYSKVISPFIENQFNTYSSLNKSNEISSKYGMQEIDITNYMSTINDEEKQKQKLQKSYANIVLFHVIFLIGLIVFYFIK
jgi:hypothetical protein